MLHRRFALSLIATATFVAAPALAAPVTVPNFSFEDDVTADGGTNYNTTTGFTLSGSAPGALVSSTVDPTTNKTGQNGDQYGVIYIDNNDGNPATPNDGAGRLTSGILTTFAANTVYTLTVGVSADPTAGLNLGAAILANGGIVSATSVSSTTLSADSFSDVIVTFDTGANPGVVGQNLTVGLTTDSTFSFGRNVLFDNVRLDATAAVVVPEPATFGLLALGLTAVAARRRP